MSTIFFIGSNSFNQYDMSLPGDISSEPISIQNLSGYSVQTSWSGASNTDARVLTEASNDKVNWVTIDVSVLSTASGSNLLNVENAMYQWIRNTFDKNSETTGILTVSVCGKTP